jgi:hypothetical protein
MAWYDKYVPKELKKPVDEFLDFGADAFKKSGKAIRKLTPRELRPVLPFLSAAVPFMLPGNFAMMGMNPMLSRGIMSSLTNALSQEALDPEGDINLLSTGLAGLTGALGADGVAQGARSGIQTNPQFAMQGADAGEFIAAGKNLPSNVGFLQGAENIGREGIAQAADFITGTGDTFSKFASQPGKLFSKAGAMELGKAIALPTAQATGDLAYSYASKAMREFEENEAEELRQAGMNEEAIANARRDAITSSMLAAAFDQEDIDATLDELGLLTLAQGGIVSLAEGGMLDFGGREMDLRGGGFVPIGKKEKADDVPARLSKNEFVMTADAVRAAGGGSVNKGAQRMYDLMNNLEARS